MEDLQNDLEDNPERANMIRHLILPPMPTVDDLVIAWIAEHKDAVLEHAFRDEDEPTQETEERAMYELEDDAEFTVEREVNLSEDRDFIEDRAGSEWELWGVIALLPRLRRVDLMDFHRLVSEEVMPVDLVEGGEGRAGYQGDNIDTSEGDGGISASIDKDATPAAALKATPSFITTVTLLRSSRTFHNSLKGHWRFSRANIIDLSSPVA